MRQITRHAVSAFLNDYTLKRSNTEVGNGVMRLHNRVIARNTAGFIEISDGGHQTNTTKERLNGLICSTIGPKHKIYQRNWIWYFNDDEGNRIPFDEAMDKQGFISLAKMRGGVK